MKVYSYEIEEHFKQSEENLILSEVYITNNNEEYSVFLQSPLINNYNKMNQKDANELIDKLFELVVDIAKTLNEVIDKYVENLEESEANQSEEDVDLKNDKCENYKYYQLIFEKENDKYIYSDFIRQTSESIREQKNSIYEILNSEIGMLIDKMVNDIDCIKEERVINFYTDGLKLYNIEIL